MKKKSRYSDGDLINAIQKPDTIDSAISFIYAEHYRFLEKVVTGNSGSAADAEDVFQEMLITFIEMIQQKKFRGEAKVSTVLYSLMRNLWLGELRKRNSSLVREETYYSGEEKVDNDIMAQLQTKEATREIFGFFDSLGESCKNLLMQFYYREMPMKEILKESGYENEQVLRNKKYKCMKKLMDMVNNSPLVKQRFKSALQHG